MPNRIIRAGINRSERVNQLDFAEEVFYRRLLNEVDDHGLFDARPSILRASLFPLRLDRVREADISRWIAKCEKAGLILLYEADGKPYLKVLDTRWQARSEPKFPPPPPRSGSNLSENKCKQLRADDNNCAQLQTIANSVEEGNPAQVQSLQQLTVKMGESDNSCAQLQTIANNCAQLRPYSETETETETETGGARARAKPPLLSPSESDLNALAEAVSNVTGIKPSSWQLESQIRTAAIELHGQGFKAAEVLETAKRSGKIYKLKFCAADLASDRAQLASVKKGNGVDQPRTMQRQQATDIARQKLFGGQSNDPR